MRPIFTIHAGEYLVATEIENKFHDYNIWLPAKDTGVDLLITNNANTKATSLQVKFSKDFSATHIKEIFRRDIKSIGWWTLNRKKILNSNADFWVFILYSLDEKVRDFIIIKPSELLNIFDNTNRAANLIHCYITVTRKHKTAYETRGLNENDIQQICENCYKHKYRNLTSYLDNWQQLTQKLS